MVNVNLGEPYELIIAHAIRLGYAGTQTEAMRQALMAYEKELQAREEAMLVNKGIRASMEKIKSGRMKTKTMQQAVKTGVFD